MRRPGSGHASAIPLVALMVIFTCLATARTRHA
jgi:hypothetical protein